MIDFKAIILRELASQKMKKTELARRAGVPYTTVNSYLTSAKKDTSGENISKMLAALGFNVVAKA